MPPKSIPVRGELPYVNTINTIPASDNDASGIAGDRSLEPPVNRYNTASETVYKGQNNCYIVLGRQRNGPPEEDFGGQGHMNCAMVDIVAGLGSWTNDNDELRYPVELANRLDTIERNPNYFVDAARILVSEKCNVDNDFALSGENIEEGSAVAMKADSVRIISREGGIKLVTNSDTFNSRGGRMVSVAPIQFLAGNAPVSMLQPVVRGDNLKLALEELMDALKSLSGIVASFLIEQLKFNMAVLTHDHFEICSIAVGSGAGKPFALNGGKTSRSFGLMRNGREPLFALNAIPLKDLTTGELNFGVWRQKFLVDYSPDFINSAHVETV